MGFWGDGNFQNDYALDWIALLIQSRDKASFIKTAIININNLKGARTEKLLCQGLAAIEVVAIINESPPSDIFELDSKHVDVIKTIKLEFDWYVLTSQALVLIKEKLYEWYFDDFLEENDKEESEEDIKRRFEQIELISVLSLEERIGVS